MREIRLAALAVLAFAGTALAQAPASSEVVLSEASLTTAPALVSEASRIYHGRSNRLGINMPRISLNQDVKIDGILDEAVWREAALLTGFSEYQPQDGLPAEDSTDVYVWYEDHAIYFGIRAFEPHGKVQANRADRDKISADDHIQILLDTFNDRRRAMVFMVNPFGSQSDGTRSEGGTGGGHNDLNEDFQYQSKGRVTDYGYEVEVRIPFKSLRYQSTKVQDWGINILREVQHSQHEQSWAPLKKGNASMLVQSGKLTGVSDIKRGLVLDFNPTITSRVVGIPQVPATAGWNYTNGKPEFGGNAVWGITPNLTMNATMNPDFSQVEADVQQNQFDPRSAVSFPEKRPFFLEGTQQFDAPNNLIYTRSIGQPIAALKLNGKQSGISIGLLSAVDDRQFSTIARVSATVDGRPNPIYNILRLKRDFGAQSTAGIVYTDRIDGGNWNRVMGGDARYVFSKIWFVGGNYSQSFDKTGTAAKTSGRRWNFNVDRTGKYFGTSYSFSGIDSLFRTRSGFANRANQASMNYSQRFTWFGKPKATIESYTFNWSVSGNWGYNHLFKGGRLDSIWGVKSTHMPNDPKLHFNNSFNLRGGWRVNANYFLETFHYDPNLYANYYIERTLPSGAKDTIPYTGVNRITNHDYSLSLTTPQFKTWRLTFNVIGGQDENFEEWAVAYVTFPTVTLDWLPTTKIRVNARYPLSLYKRMTDMSTVKRRQIPRLRVEYQATRAIFFRFVGQYDAQFRDSLRDDSRTNFPILIRSGTRYTRASITRSNNFRVDWLLSYQPNPGTVFFAGYGASLTEPEAFGFNDLNRTTDGFFVKLSYLFRM